jgi:hypothetical protein
VEFTYAYRGNTAVNSGPYRTQMSFVPDASRPPTYFSGEIGRAVPFREAISALHDVVVSDLRTQPKDRTAYKAWAESRAASDLALIAGRRADIAARCRGIEGELNALLADRSRRWGTFYQARQRYFDYLYKHERDFWYVLDPVVTVHPDEVFFECFSQDESTYGRVSVGHDSFKTRGEIACGTTNVDYSSKLYDEFQKIRSYKTTRIEVDPAGFEVQTGFDDAFREVKIDLPDSWVRGFLQVNSAMALPAHSFKLHPVDLYNLCFVLRRHRELVGPRSLRFFLKPGAPVRVLVEPFNIEVACPRSPYEGDKEAEIRIWGRRRLLVLERLLPIARGFTVHLLGTGLPSFYVADLGDMSFTLGLSGWVSNDWSSAGNFDLLAPRAQIDEFTKRRAFEGLKETWFEEPGRLADRLDLPRAAVLSALSAYAQAGRVMYDLNKGVYRVRELSREPLPLDALRFSNPREEEASRLLAARSVTVERSLRLDRPAGAGQEGAPGGRSLHGRVRDKSHAYAVSLQIDGDERIVDGACECNFFKQNRLRKGPCPHQLALRMAWARS